MSKCNECENVVQARGLCPSHYSKMRRREIALGNETLRTPCKTEGCAVKSYNDLCNKCNTKANKKKTAPCKADGCPKDTYSKWGYCDKHRNKGYWEAQKQAKAEWFERQPEDNISDAVIRYAINNDVAERLFTNTETQGDCLIWKGSSAHGYGYIGVGVNVRKGASFSHPVLTHRLAYALNNELPPSQTGPKADTLVINHICRNSLCVNPSHLEVITQQENQDYAEQPMDCVVCGTTFMGKKNRKTCGDADCMRIKHNERMRNFYRAQKAVA
jgi:hypothetical protein